MLSREDVSHLTKHWQMPPSPEKYSEALALAEQFSKAQSLARLCAGLSAVALFTNDELYRQFATALFELGLEQGISVDELMPWHVPEDGLSNHVYPIEIASQIARTFQDSDLTVGFLHGHFRVLTPANWTNVLLATENCDFLILGLEDSWRTEKYKGVKPITKDWQRWQWVLSSGFKGCLTKISRFAYTDRGYGKILKIISPDIYFGNYGISEQKRQIMTKRAKACGARFVILPEQKGFHTSEHLNSL